MEVSQHQPFHLLLLEDLAELLILMGKTGQASQNYFLLELLVVEVGGHLLQEMLAMAGMEELMAVVEVAVEPRLIIQGMLVTAELVEIELLS
jgi:hypothetical protein